MSLKLFLRQRRCTVKPGSIRAFSSNNGEDEHNFKYDSVPKDSAAVLKPESEYKKGVMYQLRL